MYRETKTHLVNSRVALFTSFLFLSPLYENSRRIAHGGCADDHKKYEQSIINSICYMLRYCFNMIWYSLFTDCPISLRKTFFLALLVYLSLILSSSLILSFLFLSFLSLSLCLRFLSFCLIISSYKLSLSFARFFFLILISLLFSHIRTHSFVHTRTLSFSSLLTLH